MKPFDLYGSRLFEDFAAAASGPFSYLEYGTKGQTRATLRSDKTRWIRCTAFFRRGAFTGHRLLCSVLPEDWKAEA